MWKKAILTMPMFFLIMMFGCIIVKATESMWYLPELIKSQTRLSQLRETHVIIAFCNENKDICDD